MKSSLLLPVLLGVACAQTPAVDPEPPVETSAPVEQVEAPPPIVSDPQPVASDAPRLKLEMNRPQALGDEVEVELTNFVIEILAPETDSYVQVFETVAQVEFRISIGDHSEAIEMRIWTSEQGPWELPVVVWGQLARITVLEVQYVDSQPAVAVSMARYGEPAEATQLRLETGQRVALADVELELRGHTDPVDYIDFDTTRVLWRSRFSWEEPW